MLSLNEIFILVKIAFVFFILPAPLVLILKYKSLIYRYTFSFLITTITLTFLNGLFVYLGIKGILFFKLLFWFLIVFVIYWLVKNHKKIKLNFKITKEKIINNLILSGIFIFAFYLRLKPALTNHLFHAHDTYVNYLQTILLEMGKQSLFNFNKRYYILTYHLFNSVINKIVSVKLFYLYRFVGPIVAIFTVVLFYFILKEIGLDKRVNYLLLAAFSWIGRKSYLAFQILERGNQTISQEFAFLFLLVLIYFLIQQFKKDTLLNKTAVFLSFILILLIHPTVIGLVSFFIINIFFLLSLFLKKNYKIWIIYFAVINLLYISFAYLIKFNFFTKNLAHLITQVNFKLIIIPIIFFSFFLFYKKAKLLDKLDKEEKNNLFFIIFF